MTILPGLFRTYVVMNAINSIAPHNDNNKTQSIRGLILKWFTESSNKNFIESLKHNIILRKKNSFFSSQRCSLGN